MTSQVIVETDLREDAARTVALDVFTVIADAEADVPANGRVATLTQDSADSTIWWADIVEDIPDYPPTVTQRGRWRLQLGTPGYVSTPDTVCSGRGVTDTPQQRTTGNYQVLDNLRNPSDTNLDFMFDVVEASAFWTELDHSVKTAAGITVPANERLGSGAGSLATALNALGWPTSITADAAHSRTVTLEGTIKAEADRRYAVVGLQTYVESTTPITLGVVLDWGMIQLTPPGGARSFEPAAMTFTSVGDLARMFAGHNADASRLAGWVPGSWEARESLERLADECGRMYHVGARRIGTVARNPVYAVVDVTAFTDTEIAARFGTAGRPVEGTVEPETIDGYVPGSGPYRDVLLSVPDGYGNLETGTVTEEYLLYLAERHISGALADIFTEFWANHEGQVVENKLDPENHTYYWRLADRDGDRLAVQGAGPGEDHTHWFHVVFSEQIYIPGDGKITKTNCTPITPTNEDTDDDTITLQGPISYDNTVTVTETTETNTTFTQTVEFENGITVNAGEGIDSVSDTLTSRFGFSASESKDTTVTKSVAVEIQVMVPSGQTWTLHMVVSRGGQSCEVNINAVPSWQVAIHGGDEMNCRSNPRAYTFKNYVCPGDVVDGDLLEFDSLSQFLSWLGGYDIRNLQMKGFVPKGLAVNGIKYLSNDENYRIRFNGRQVDTSDSNASYRVEKNNQ